MTNAELKKQLETGGDSFYNGSCYKLKLEIVKKIVNCRAIPDVDKIALFETYIKNLTTNNSVLENIKEYNNRGVKGAC